MYKSLQLITSLEVSIAPERGACSEGCKEGCKQNCVGVVGLEGPYFIPSSDFSVRRQEEKLGERE